MLVIQRNDVSKAEKKCSNISYYLEARKFRGKRGRDRAFMSGQFIVACAFRVVGLCYANVWLG